MEEDKFSQEWQTQRQKVLACQERKGVGSCLRCSIVLECALRQAFVQSVYLSMNKGKQGNFDF
ncbi:MULTISPECIES: hypothetical protein [Helicobacter]|uniref:hypothetical protein n=1 Tax=Helicobacter TaxID=209 RepID=UPI000EAC23E7|nr:MULTISPECIES: hypothetical protein [Helicobacter]